MQSIHSAGDLLVARSTTSVPLNRLPLQSQCWSAVVLLTSALAPLTGIAADIETPVDGKAIYDKACGRCHNAGPGSFFTGAPKIGSDLWKPRLASAGSVDALVVSAAKGKGKMPAQGGPSGFSDSDLKAAVEYILSKSP